MDEESQAGKESTSPANSQKPAQSAGSSDSSAAMPPEQLGINYVAAENYKSYLDRLRSGGASTVSASFGSALDLLCDSSEPEPIARLDVSLLEPKSKEETEARMIYFTLLILLDNRDFLLDYAFKCKKGEFGKRAKQCILKVNNEKFANALKEFTCAGVYLTAIEQVDPETSPEWLRHLLGGSLAAIDMLAPGASAKAILKRFETTFIALTSRTVTTDLSYLFGFGEIGDSSWDALYSRLRNSNKKRQELLFTTLTKELSLIHAEISPYVKARPAGD